MTRSGDARVARFGAGVLLTVEAVRLRGLFVAAAFAAAAEDTGATAFLGVAVLAKAGPARCAASDSGNQLIP